MYTINNPRALFNAGRSIVQNDESSDSKTKSVRAAIPHPSLEQMPSFLPGIVSQCCEEKIQTINVRRHIYEKKTVGREADDSIRQTFELCEIVIHRSALLKLEEGSLRVIVKGGCKS